MTATEPARAPFTPTTKFIWLVRCNGVTHEFDLQSRAEVFAENNGKCACPFIVEASYKVQS